MAPVSLQDEVQAILDSACSDPEILPGAVFVMVNRNGEYLVKAAAGIRGLDKPEEKMTSDTAFVGFSCTKVRAYMLPTYACELESCTPDISLMGQLITTMACL